MTVHVMQEPMDLTVAIKMDILDSGAATNCSYLYCLPSTRLWIGVLPPVCLQRHRNVSDPNGKKLCSVDERLPILSRDLFADVLCTVAKFYFRGNVVIIGGKR